MKKILLLIPVFLLLIGCTNKVEEEKYAYLEYKNNLENQEDFTNDEGLDFNTHFNLIREDEEKIIYNITIDNPKINMYNIKALLIHDYVTEDIFPSVGIFDEPLELSANSENKIVLEGTIQTLEDIKDTRFKLYIEYNDDAGNENKIYYEVQRG